MSILADSKSRLAVPEKIKALAMDLDGTVLAPGGILSGRTKKAIEGCMERGIKVIIATGRPIEAVESYRASLGAEGPMIYFNGAVVVDMPGGKILKTTLMNKEAVEFCIDLSREMGVYCQIYIQKKGDSRMPLVAERDDPERRLYHERIGILAELVDFKETMQSPELEGCVKAMLLAEPEIIAKIRPRLDERLGGKSALPRKAYIAQTQKTFLEVMDTETSKGRGLLFAMECLSLKGEEVIAFGDEENDLPMFGVAGFSVAPSNAKEAVKAQADLVAASNEEDGVAAFLEDFFGL